ncbi:MAG: VOC family protein [Dehalococcoidia bacterium]
MITNVRTAAVYVSDQEAALRFYTEKLGFEVRRTESMGRHGSWLEVAPPGAQSRLVIYPRAMMEDWEQRKPSIVFGCDDIEKTYSELAERDVKFTQTPTKMRWGTFAIFADPDGNEFVLSEGT